MCIIHAINSWKFPWNMLHLWKPTKSRKSYSSVSRGTNSNRNLGLIWTCTELLEMIGGCMCVYIWYMLILDRVDSYSSIGVHMKHTYLHNCVCTVGVHVYIGVLYRCACKSHVQTHVCISIRNHMQVFAGKEKHAQKSYCNKLQHTAKHCNTLRHTATQRYMQVRADQT